MKKITGNGLRSTVNGLFARRPSPVAAIRICIVLAFIVFQALVVRVPVASAINYCGPIGALVGIGASCKTSCDGSEVDVTAFKYFVPEQYQAQFNSLCASGQVCCAAKGDTLCSKATSQISLEGSCASACASGYQTLTQKISNIPELCSSGSCCVPGSQGTTVKGLSETEGNAATKLQQTTKGVPSSGATKELPSPGYGLINPLGSRSVHTLMADFIKWISGFAGSLFMLYLLWGGLEWMTSRGDPKKVKEAQNRIVYSILGVIIIFLAYFIVDLLIGLTNIQF